MKDWINQIDSTTDQFIQRFGTLTAEQLNWRPSTDKWSIAQNIDHLIVINETYFPILSDLRNGTYKTPFIGRFGFITSMFGKMILNSVQPDRKKKIKTFPIWEPSLSEIPRDVLDRFSNHQTRLKDEIMASEDLLQAKVCISSPANKYIVYKLQTAFDIIVAHELRHLEQAKEILALYKRSYVN